MGSDRWTAILVVGLTMLLRVPTLFEPHHYADEGIFAAVAQRLLQGHALYTGAWDDKPPLIFWTYAGVEALFGPSMVALRLLGAAWAAGLAAAVTLLGRRLLGPRIGLGVGVACAVLASLPLIEANLSLTELFAAMPVAWAFVLAVGKRETAGRVWVAAGVLLGVGFLYKQVAALDAAAVGTFLLVRRRAGVGPLVLLVAGFVVPNALAAVILAAQGALVEGIRAVFGFYRGYLQEGTAVSPLLRAGMFLPVLVALGATAARARRHEPTERDLIMLWLGFASLGALLAGRAYGHYLVQIVAPASLAGGLLIREATRRRPAWALWTLSAITAVVVWASFSDFWLYHPVVRPYYYVNTFQYVTGVWSRQAYDQVFYWRVQDQEQLAAIIRSDGERTLYAWGEYPWLYPLADAESPTRYVTSYHTSFHPDAKIEVMAALRLAPPRFIAWDRDEWRRLPSLDELVAERYEWVARVHHTDLYRRRDIAAQ